MNSARKTFNTYLAARLAVLLPAFSIWTGDETNPEVKAPAVVIRWLDGAQNSGRLPESRVRLVQLDVFTNKQATSVAEAACEQVLTALHIRTGMNPMGLIPKMNFSVNPAGILDGTTLIVTIPYGRGWQRLEPPQQAARLYAITLEVDYVPDNS